MLTSAEPKSWSPSLQEAVKAEELGVVDYDLTLDYNYWNYRTYVEPAVHPRNF
jgi:hypothetical protein